MIFYEEETDMAEEKEPLDNSRLGKSKRKLARLQNEYKREEFRNAYERYMDALKKDRLSADDFGNITDSKGELGNVDGDDYWYDNKGNRISGAEYRALSVRKQKKYRAFYANKEVATYFNEIAKAIVNRRYSHNM